MAELDKRYGRFGVATRAEPGVMDEGLRSYMLGVYNYMAAGIVLTGIVAYFMFSMLTTTDPALAAAQLRNGVLLTETGRAVYASPLMWVIVLAPLAFVLLLSFRIYSMSSSATQIAFWAFAAVMGASLSTIFLRYTGQSITQIFFVTAAAFAALSLYGYTTKKDLSGWGTFLFMGVIGLILAMLVNIWLQSPALYFALSAICVLVFAGLTAYDTQQIKDNYYMIAGDGEMLAKGAVMGALHLYLDFINMFQGLLALFGNRE
ncbi:MAG: Bax inhibitor-1/YccA family protein [Hyphomicrobiaceae bacterium]